MTRTSTLYNRTEIGRIGSLITRMLFASCAPKVTWTILNVLTGERISSNVNDEAGINKLSFIRHHRASEHEPLCLPMSTVFQTLKLKLSFEISLSQVVRGMPIYIYVCVCVCV